MPTNRSHQGKATQSKSRPNSGPGRDSAHKTRDFPVVGIGASAGGLDACKKFLGALPAGNGMAFILIQHLHPDHASMMVDLLSHHTAMTVLQAAEGMRIEPDHFYIIPPGAYLSVDNGTLHLSPPNARHGARLPFDFLLHSLASDYGVRAVGIILSGTWVDGTEGLQALKERGGFVIVQDPNEATYDGMPRSAIATGAVDLVLPIAKNPRALIEYGRRLTGPGAQGSLRPQDNALDWLPRIIALLRTKTAHNFTLYKPGTLRRRIERHMTMTDVATDDFERYLEILQNDAAQLDRLAKYLLINVTSFFRDRKVFDLLAEKIIPDMVRKHISDQPLRIWIAGCSSGEEAYSLAMLFLEQTTATEPNVRLQVFASDIDPDAVASAREGRYPEAIAADVSPARLARYFLKEGQSYRVRPELRETVVFTVQDVLADPPFSNVDLISCRNLLIYLRPEAQAKVLSIFDFALRQEGVLLLGSAETVGSHDICFQTVSNSERIYRHVGHKKRANLQFSMNNSLGIRIPPHQAAGQPDSAGETLAELCQRLVLENYAPAAVLINDKHECLYSLGPTDTYLRVAPGHPQNDLLAMARDGLQTKLRSAIQQASRGQDRIVVPGGQMPRNGDAFSFSITVQPVQHAGQALLLVCFIDDPKPTHVPDGMPSPGDLPEVTALQQELEATRTELQNTIRSLELSSEEQKAVNEEALSINEEFQSTNEELVTSKEELQSLNEELAALNTQIQETLARERTTSNDLQNVLYSADVATVFLDRDLKIRLFTPTTKLLFSIIPSDIGRPLADLNSLATDVALLADSRTVLQTLAPLEREIEAQSGTWYVRRIFPYRTQDDRIEGVVITFTDITERRHAADALVAAERQARMANIAKSRFLAAASHDLRQPLQALKLVRGVLAKKIRENKNAEALGLVERIDEMAATMTGMLDALLDINQIDAGTVQAKIVSFPINGMLVRLRDEFVYAAQARGLSLRVVPCSLAIQTDPHLLEQMIRNLLANALKYTRRGKVLIGCRRHAGRLSIEVWDTGIGIPEQELDAIFEEYHQLDNAARERARGLGLGLSIVRRLGNVLGHPVHVRSQLGKGSVFAIEAALAPSATASHPGDHRQDVGDVIAEGMISDDNVEGDHRNGGILIVEDDPEVRELLDLLLAEEGHRITTAADGAAALELVAQGKVNPDLILADFNLPGGMNGLQVAANVRKDLRRPIPVIILTGDISIETLRDIQAQHCVHFNKPVNAVELTEVIQGLLRISQPAIPVSVPPTIELPTGTTTSNSGSTIIYVVDDDRQVLEAFRTVLEDDGQTVEAYESSEAFLEAYHPGGESCLLVDAYLPGMNGVELLQRLHDLGHRLPAVMITGYGDVPTAVQAMKAGASDFIEKPVGREELLASIERAVEQSRDSSKRSAWREAAAGQVARLTPRQREIMELVLAGHPSKNIAADLGISQRTVENHRASIMKKTGSTSLPALARLALAAARNGSDEPPV